MDEVRNKELLIIHNKRKSLGEEREIMNAKRLALSEHHAKESERRETEKILGGEKKESSSCTNCFSSSARSQDENVYIELVSWGPEEAPNYNTGIS